MKKLLLLFMCVLCMTGCSSSDEKQKDTYPKPQISAGQGEVRSLTLDEAIEKKNGKESYLLILTQTYCSHCLNFFMETDAYTKESGITLWDVTLDKEERSQTKILSLIKENFGEFSSTPSLYFIADGKVQSSLLSSESDVDLEAYKDWLKELDIVR